ncbi:urease subunit gamma, partial [Streptomyces mirabilis]|uniref:urease subunit gamma n=1 Tax=Streptomyces mirabilis TaxID=68239 RepID=UPI003318005D
MRLTPTERDRLLLFGAAELARARRARGLRLNVPEATALIADTVCEAARDGRRLAEAIAAARAAPADVRMRPLSTNNTSGSTSTSGNSRASASH